MDKVGVLGNVQLSTGMDERMKNWLISDFRPEMSTDAERTGSPLMIVWTSEPSPRRRLRCMNAESPLSLERVVTTWL
jgi:hypothetical protein